MRCPICKTSLKDEEMYVCDKCKKLPQQLEEKDKEIEELKAKLLSKECWEFVENIERKNKEYFENPQDIMFCSENQLEPIIRHQVCEEIRYELFNTEFKKAINDLGKIWLLNLLEQIEGE